MRPAILLGVLTLAAAPAHAQVISVPCGGQVLIDNTSSGFGTNGWIQYTVQTRAATQVCIARVIVDAHVVGISNSSLHAEAVTAATAVKQVPTPWDGIWLTNGVQGY